MEIIRPKPRRPSTNSMANRPPAQLPNQAQLSPEPQRQLTPVEHEYERIRTDSDAERLSSNTPRPRTPHSSGLKREGTGSAPVLPAIRSFSTSRENLLSSSNVNVRSSPPKLSLFPFKRMSPARLFGGSSKDNSSKPSGRDSVTSAKSDTPVSVRTHFRAMINRTPVVSGNGAANVQRANTPKNFINRVVSPPARIQSPESGVDCHALSPVAKMVGFIF